MDSSKSALECYKELYNAILNGRWKSSEYNECIYYCRAEEGRIAVLVTYVDDIVVARTTKRKCKGCLIAY